MSLTDSAEQQRRDAIVEEYDDTEPCRHGSRFWCEACVTDAYKLHSAISRAEGLKEAVGIVSQLAGEAYLQDRTEVAAAMKTLVNKLTALIKQWESTANDLRRAQGVRR